MKHSITIEHGLPYFCVTSEPELHPMSDGRMAYVTRGISEEPMSDVCGECGRKMHRHGSYERTIRDIDLMGRMSIIKAAGARMRCPGCHRVTRQAMGFSDPHHNLTRRLREQIQRSLNAGSTITECSRLFRLHPSTIYAIDKEHLSSIYSGKRPKPVRYIGIDEFLLHHNHRYATVVVDLEEGHVLFLEEGKRKQQAYDFFRYVGDDWMMQVVAVSMDMNAQYDSAFRERYPHIRIVYDFFHMVKMYNDTVLTAIRRRLQNELAESDEDGYKLLKNSRFILLSSAETLERKDREAAENNERLRRDYLSKHLPLPPGERLMRTGQRWKLREILRRNRTLQTAYFLLEQFRLAYSVDSREGMEAGMKAWIRLARQSGCAEIERFCNAISSRLDGILNHAEFHIDSAVTEGTNNMIKTARRKAYGFRDTEYFFLKIIHESWKPRFKYKSNRFL